MREELFDYSDKSTEWVKKILFANREALRGRGPIALYTKIYESAYAEIKKRGIEA